MANLEDLGFKSLSDVSTDEALELIRQIRLSRRVNKEKSQAISKTKKPKKAPAPTVNADQAAELLKLLKGE